MRITKFGHACVRIEHEGATIVLDPGGFTSPEAVDGADAVLITHQHPDHLDAANLRRTDAPVLTIGAVAAAIAADAPDLSERVSVVAPGERFTAAGVQVEAVNEKHAVIHPEYDRFDNSGYLLTLPGAGQNTGQDGAATTVFHPGDSLDGPGRPVDVLLLPVSAPWLRIRDAIDFARDTAAPRNLAIHDQVYSDAGLAMADAHLRTFLEPAGLEYARLAEGQDL
ncbi:MBL fold metallo-hydrolase [Nocardioides bruguierae]|uniref:MBL fold metallo-hydrolase n=1 Tax=Nocardioides bruguierae TaxID=2945102 RepID=A0A9X2IGN0_9ACTN|nr:MBL fold metallo-hydrolase [Nocardioides bruguierae]MCM0621744.1 MBL fold metallo-hydrolase [Nocardioides bruguierae]